MSGERCAEPRCGRFVRANAMWCGRHQDANDDTANNHEAEDRATGRARATFRAALRRGDYRALLDRRFDEVLAQAASERGLTEEIGALRFVLKRLLAEEQNLTRLAAGVARVVGVAIRAAQVEKAIGGEAADGLAAALSTVLAELDRERAMQRDDAMGGEE